MEPWTGDPDQMLLGTIWNPIDRHTSDADSFGYDTQDIPEESEGGNSTYPSETESSLSAVPKGAKRSATLPATRNTGGVSRGQQTR
jgi:hypothetical protein